MIAYCKDFIIADKVDLANSFGKRFLGLMGKKSLRDGEGLLLWHCASIHCFFMKIPIDVIYLSKYMTVLGIETLKPWSVGSNFNNTVHVLELKAGIATSKVNVGDAIVFNPTK